MKSISMGLSEEESTFIEGIKLDMSNTEFLREVMLTSTLIQNHARRMGKDPEQIFRRKQNGGKRPGAGNPNWIKKKKD